MSDIGADGCCVGIIDDGSFVCEGDGNIVGLVDVGLVFGLLVVGLVVGDVVGLAVCSALSQTEASCVAVGIEAQSALVALKNPISFHVGRNDMSTSQT